MTDHSIVIRSQAIHNQNAVCFIQVLTFFSIFYEVGIATSALVIRHRYQNEQCLNHVSTLIPYSAWLLWVGIFHMATIVIRGICLFYSETKWLRGILAIRLWIVFEWWIVGIVFFTQSIAIYCEGPLYIFAISYICLQAIAIVMDCIVLQRSNNI